MSQTKDLPSSERRTFVGQDNEYKVVQIIGSGAMATVYRCTARDNTTVAIKWLTQNHQAAINRFNREIVQLAQFNHPNIIRVHDKGIEESLPFYVMDYVEGPDLRVYAQKLQERPPLERYLRCRRIGQDIAQALQTIHMQYCIHRDVKPSNILIAPDGHAILTDFGVIKIQTENTEHSQFIGTPAYAAPEQLVQDHISSASDQFSLGATLYFALTNKRPFKNMERQAPVPPSHVDPSIPAELETCILRMLQIRPEKRYLSMQEIIDALTHTQSAGMPLAGRQRLLEKSSRIIDEAANGTSLIIHISGIPGVGKRWFADTVISAAQRRGVSYFEINDKRSLDVVKQRLKEQAILIIDWSGLLVGSSLAEHRNVEVPPLRRADVRRTIYAFAPHTSNLSKTAEKVFQVTGGLPSLLFPIFSNYINDQHLILPEKIELDEAEPYLEDVELEDVELLSVFGIANRSLTISEIEKVTMFPVEENLVSLSEKGLVCKTEHQLWRCSADIFAQKAMRLAPDLEGIKHRYRRLSNVIAPPKPIERILLEAANGSLAKAKADLQERIHRLDVDSQRDERCESLIAYGMILTDIGIYDEASSVLADASALAKACQNKELQTWSHQLRSRVVLEQKSKARSAAASAIDRLTPLIQNNVDPRTEALWAWSMAILQESSGWKKAFNRSMSLMKHDVLPRVKIRSLLYLMRSCCAIGEKKVLSDIIQQHQRLFVEHQFYAWELSRIEVILSGKKPLPTSPIALGLEPGEIAALKRRWVYAKGFSPDPTWGD